MNCPQCQKPDTRVTKTFDDGACVKRARACTCGFKFNSTELSDWALMAITSQGKSLLIANGLPPPKQQKAAHVTTRNHSQPAAQQAIAVSDPVRSSSVSHPVSPEPSQPTEEITASMSAGGGGLFAWAMGQFVTAWGKKRGALYKPTPADKNQLGRLLQTLSREEAMDLPRAFAAYLADLSPFVAQEQGHNLAWFCTSGGRNKYLSVTPVVSAKEARTVAAGEQWLAIQEGGNGRR